MRDRNAYYREKAAQAAEQAKRAASARDREAWLKLAQDWLNLLPKRAQTQGEQFSEQVRSAGTHQDVSEREQ